MTTYTTNKGLQEPAYNDPNWNTPLNTNFDIIDNALGAFVNIPTINGNYALPTGDLQCMCWKSNTSAFTGNVTYTIPTGIKGQWVVINQSDASSYTLSVVCGSSSILVDRGKSRSIYCDGTSVFYADSPATAGADTQVIYNSAGSLVGSSNLTFNGAAVSIGGSTATTGASCSGTTATVTFSNGQTIPVGSVVTITGVTPTGYNGSWVTTGTATLNQVKFTVPSTLTSQTVAGTLSYGNLNLGGNLIGGIASQALATAGTNNSAIMTPLATAQAITAQTVSGGMTLLGTVATTSGNSKSISGLSLTGYKSIQCVMSAISTTGSSTIVLNSNIVATTGGSGNYVSGIVYVDLTTGVITSTYATPSSTTGTSSGSVYSGVSTGITTSTTDITIAIASGGTFDNGSLTVYGIR